MDEEAYEFVKVEERIIEQHGRSHVYVEYKRVKPHATINEYGEIKNNYSTETVSATGPDRAAADKRVQELIEKRRHRMHDD